MKLGIVAMPVHAVAEVPLRAIAAASALSLAPLVVEPRGQHTIFITSFVRTARRDTVRTETGDSPDRGPLPRTRRELATEHALGRGDRAKRDRGWAAPLHARLRARTRAS